MRTIRNILLYIVVVFSGGAFLLSVAPNVEAYAGYEKHGPFDPQIIDADTLKNGNTTFRIVGIDACELGQPIEFPQKSKTVDCGIYATKIVTEFIGSSQVVCYDRGQRSYDRIVARCFRNDFEKSARLSNDIGAFALYSGWAELSGSDNGIVGIRYLFEEIRSKFRGYGMWNGTVVSPREWRESNS